LQKFLCNFSRKYLNEHSKGLVYDEQNLVQMLKEELENESSIQPELIENIKTNQNYFKNDPLE
jgi:hypothetical protein